MFPCMCTCVEIHLPDPLLAPITPTVLPPHITPPPPTVLPPVLVPRNPQPITSIYEPTPSYMESQRASFSPISPNNDMSHPSIFDSPGKPSDDIHD